MNSKSFLNVFYAAKLRKYTGVWLATVSVLGMLLLLVTSCSQKQPAVKPADVDYYTCTMHPSVKSQDPNAKCPICGMDLVPVKKKGAPAEQAQQRTP